MRLLVVRPEAEADLAGAVDWYEAARPGLGDEFLVEFTKILDLIHRMPELFSVDYRTARRGLLSRFPYAVHYLVTSECVMVIAVLHSSRDKRRILRRRM